jgi:hypothetical protein
MSVEPVISPENTGIDREHPWPGLDSFTEKDCEYFYGRPDETADLFRLVKRDTLTVLFGSSGLGKTSLLKAGLFPKLIEAEFLPIYLRLTHGDAAEPLANQVRRELKALIDAHHVDARKPREGENLSSYFHRNDVDFWGAKNRLLIPVLVFDQFEEIFTLGRENVARQERAKDFLRELADLVERRPPTALKQKWESGKEQVTNFSFEHEKCKIILSLREDYLSDLEGLRPYMRSVMRNRLRIRRMNGKNAFDVVVKPAPGLVDKEVATRLVQLVADSRTPVENAALSEDQLKGLEIEPPLLSLVCSELNARRIEHEQPKITADLLAKSYHDILKTFYTESLANLSPEVRFFIEDRLLTRSGYRTSVAIEDALAQKGMTKEIIEKLRKCRLLTVEPRLGVLSIELTHDILTPVIRESRDARLTSEARAEADRLRAREVVQRRKQQITAAVAYALALTLIGTVCGGYYFFFMEHKAYYRDFEKRNGFPVGIMQISKSQARRLPVSFRLTHKGIMRDGWKLDWKPVFRVEAVNSLLELTTNHSVYPYLWKGELEAQAPPDTEQGEKSEQLGLKTVCQWEFVSTKEGEIICERALDRSGRMVYGLVYSPPGSDVGKSRGEIFGPAPKPADSSKVETRPILSNAVAKTASGDRVDSSKVKTRPILSSTRLARFVDSVGFPLLLGRSAAEYVQIHYDTNGWEDRVMYRDGKGVPSVGPDGAFGQSMKHDKLSGRLKCVLSLNADGKPMVDDTGNSGMKLKYDNRGFDTEDRSVGTKKEPMPVKDEWFTRKNRYDGFGRLRQTAYYGVNGEAVLSKKSGCHGWKAEYDEHGNQTLITYLGLDDKPMTLTDGYATVGLAYDARNNPILVIYYGADGKSVILEKKGYHGWYAEYEEHDNQTMITYLGLDDKPVALDDGYATMKSTYDARGNMTSVRYYDINGESVLSKQDDYHGFDAAYDEQNNQTCITFLSKDSKPMTIADGYATAEMKYDPRGKMTQKRFYGVNGEAVLSKKNGWHGWKAEYDERGNRTVMTYLGLDDKPMTLADGYATMKSTYDARGNVIRQTFYGANGESVKSQDGGYHGWEAEYDEYGKQTVITYLGLDHNPMTLADYGYATIKSTYDARGNRIAAKFYDVNGVPALSKKLGHHGWEAEYDKQGNPILTTYIGPTLIAKGYAEVLSSYDADGNVTEETYYGVNGEAVLCEGGYHGYSAEYDGQGNTTFTYLGLNDKPMPIPDGFLTMKRGYDARGNVTHEAYYGIHSEPVLSKENGYHGFDAAYDEHDKRTMITYLGLNEKPMLLADGYAKIESTYDARGNVTRASCYGVNGEPALSKKDGYHGWEAQYDDRRNQIAFTYLGLDRKPMVMGDGYATRKMVYDSGGNMTQESFYDLNGEPALSKKERCYSWKAEYDEKGNQTGKVCLGLDRKPIPCQSE